MADKCAYMACRRYGFPFTDDVRQEAKLKVWLSVFRDKTCASIKTVATRAVIDSKRRELGRYGKRPVIHTYPRRDLESAVTGSRVSVELLDEVEAVLEGDERLIFRHMRRGHDHIMVAKAMGLTRTTTWRRMVDVLEHARRILIHE